MISILKLKKIETVSGLSVDPRIAYIKNAGQPPMLQLHYYNLFIEPNVRPDKPATVIGFKREGANIHSVWKLPTKDGVRYDEDGYASSLKSFYHNVDSSVNSQRTLTVRLYDSKIQVENNMSAIMNLIFKSHADAELVYDELRKKY